MKSQANALKNLINSLTEKEKQVVSCIIVAGKSNGGDFALTEDIVPPQGMSRKALGGVLSSLQAKKVIDIDGVDTSEAHYEQVTFRDDKFEDLFVCTPTKKVKEKAVTKKAKMFVVVDNRGNYCTLHCGVDSSNPDAYGLWMDNDKRLLKGSFNATIFTSKAVAQKAVASATKHSSDFYDSRIERLTKDINGKTFGEHEAEREVATLKARVKKPGRGISVASQKEALVRAERRLKSFAEIRAKDRKALAALKKEGKRSFFIVELV